MIDDASNPDRRFVGIEPAHDASAFAEFADTIHGYRARTEQLVRGALARAGDSSSQVFADLAVVSREIQDTFETLDNAAEEIRVQNEALFAARTELEDSSALFRDLFEFAPTPYLVTTVDARVIYANDAACRLFAIAKNALSGKPLICFIALEDRAQFRETLARARESATVSTWPQALMSRRCRARVECRLRVRSVSAPGRLIARMLYWNITEETDEDLF